MNIILARWNILGGLFSALCDLYRTVDEIEDSSEDAKRIALLHVEACLKSAASALTRLKEIAMDAATLRPELESQSQKIISALEAIEIEYITLGEEDSDDANIQHFIKDFRIYMNEDLPKQIAENRVFHPNTREDWYVLFLWPFERIAQKLVKYLLHDGCVFDTILLGDLCDILKVAGNSSLNGNKPSLIGSAVIGESKME